MGTRVQKKVYVTSPKTGREILVGGPTYEKLMTSPKWSPQLKRSPKKVKTVTKKTASRVYPSGKAPPGCSNMGKYPNVAADDFCGPAGGSCPRTYPVNTRQRARAALSYARHAPNPSGIKRCVRNKSAKKGWIDPRTGKLKMK